LQRVIGLAVREFLQEYGDLWQRKRSVTGKLNANPPLIDLLVPAIISACRFDYRLSRFYI